jgi:hypothetical protein
MTDRRGNGNGNGHYRGESAHADPTENVKELVALQAVRHAEALAALALRIDQRDKIREIHRLEMARMAELIAVERTERLKAEAATEKERVNAVIAAGQAAVVLLSTETKAVAGALATQVETTRKATETQVESSAAALRATNEASTKALTDRIAPLERAQFAAVGVKEQRTEGKAHNRWIIGIAMSAPAWLLAIITLVLLLTK